MLDVIICANFGVEKLRGLWSTRGQILEFPIEMARHPYNSAVLPCSLRKRCSIYGQFNELSETLTDFNFWHTASQRNLTKMTVVLAISYQYCCYSTLWNSVVVVWPFTKMNSYCVAHALAQKWLIEQRQTRVTDIISQKVTRVTQHHLWSKCLFPAWMQAVDDTICQQHVQ